MIISSSHSTNNKRPQYKLWPRSPIIFTLSVPDYLSRSRSSSSHLLWDCSPYSRTFFGEQKKCRDSLLRFPHVFRRSPHSLGVILDDTSRISYIIGLLRGQVLRKEAQSF
ncbi:hypothetical protein CHARACLAT_029206 [Characodon lateralis]|uniref:Uncharacterized protein n=1 Tax=Characodon lateralis TaxID=208331 RepID=A0ABU7CW94_9TELE|nr:hypothetical protein [Characodon lateralis]